MTELNSEAGAKAAELRTELKAWEKLFAAEHDGRKAGRDDIRANAAIAAKYKEYNKLRDILSGKRDFPQSPSQSRKRKAVMEPPATPSKRLAVPSATPSKRAGQDNLLATPGTATKSTPSSRLPNFIGPTPQKDGLVIGLFDLLPAETPSKKRTVLGEIGQELNIAQTPRKHELDSEDEFGEMGRKRGMRTPMSAGKRFFLDRFATPSKRKREEEPETPTSVSKDHCTTPLFLRRDVALLDMIPEDEDFRPRPPPFQKRGLVRSLSSMIQKAKKQEEEARKQEEERLDDDWDLLREMEEEAGSGLPTERSAPRILVQDSQAPEMPLGPDQLPESEDEQEEAEAGQSRMPWKKKGQKRQTRRFILRPVQTKPQGQTDQGVESSDDELAAVADSQRPDAAGRQENGESGSDYDSDASDAWHTAKKSKAAAAKAMNAAKDAKPAEGKFRRTVRKLNEQAHANYRRLKIKNKNSKANGRGRFGRR